VTSQEGVRHEGALNYQLTTWGLDAGMGVGGPRLASCLAIAHGLLLCMRSWQKPGLGAPQPCRRPWDPGMPGSHSLHAPDSMRTPTALCNLLLQCCCTGVSVQCSARYPTEYALRAAVSGSTLWLTVQRPIQSLNRTISNCEDHVLHDARSRRVVLLLGYSESPSCTTLLAMLSVRESKTGRIPYGTLLHCPEGRGQL
jgi:hypothetical protein